MPCRSAPISVAKHPEHLWKQPILLVPKPDVKAANQAWYSDITMIKTAEGWELGPLGPGFARSSFTWP